MPKLIVANWKLNPTTEKEAVWLARAVDTKGVVLCPPFPFLAAVKGHVKKGALGAQDVFWEGSGAYTGEVSGEMLHELGAKYAIVGHSERRMHLGETDEMVGKKCAAALRAKITPILCVGEPLAVRRKGTAAVLHYVRRQLAAAARYIPKNLRRSIVVAYEPIWAIGTGIPCHVFEAERMVKVCAAFLVLKEKFRSVHGLYGGSVNGQNAKSYLDAEYIDGLLVGGASLRAEEFKKIVAAGR